MTNLSHNNNFPLPASLVSAIFERYDTKHEKHSSIDLTPNRSVCETMQTRWLQKARRRECSSETRVDDHNSSEKKQQLNDQLSKSRLSLAAIHILCSH